MALVAFSMGAAIRITHVLSPDPLTPTQTLSRPPILEAVIDLRATAPSPVSSSAFADLKRLMVERFPVVEEIRNIEATLNILPEGASHAETKDIATGELLFRSADRKYAVQCRTTGLAVSRLQPYENFELALAQFDWCWARYQSVVRANTIVRTALRFINRFPVPAAGDLDDYLKLPPISPIPNWSLQQHMQRTLLFKPGSANRAIVTTALEPSIDGANPSAVIDIDVFTEASMSDDPILRSNVFRSLRSLKNEIFFALLGDIAREEFE